MSRTRQLTWGALFVAIGVLLPIMFHVVNLGKMFLPMHIPVLLAGFFCGPLVGMLVGLVTPLVSAILTGMPPLMPPVAQMMVCELGIYGLLTGYLYQRLRLGVYPALVTALVAGRLVYGFLGFSLLPLFGLQRIPLLYPVSYGLLSGLPGIIIQMVLIPGVVLLVERNAAVLVSGKKAGKAHA